MKRKITNSRYETGKAGFTFIELVIVLVIIGVVSSISGPHLARFYKSLKLNASARQLMTVINFARGTAISEKNICKIQFDKNWRKLSLFLKEEPDSFKPLEGGLSKLTIMEGITIDSIKKNSTNVSKESEFPLLIHPLYSPEEVSFLLKDQEGEQLTVIIQAGGGRVVIEEQVE